MPKTVRYQMEPFFFHYPSVAAIVTSHAGTKSNAMAVAWHAPMSHTPPYYLVSISPKRYTHGLIVESGEFVVNFMPWEKSRVVASVASCSGKDVDKFKAFGIKAAPGARVAAPVLEDALAAYECTVLDRRTYGDHDLFMGEIVAVHHDPAAFDADGQLALEGHKPVLYLGNEQYTTAGQRVLIDRRPLAPTATPR